MPRYLTKIFLFLILLPAVSASSFTGSFNDYGKDIDSDGLFNYLTIDAGVNIDQVKNHTIYGLLKDSLGNSLEYSKCMSLTPGSYTFSLDFSGITIYRNQVNGPYNLKYIELSSKPSCSGFDELPKKEHSLDNAYTTSFYSYTEFQTGEAAIYCSNSPCTASSSLIKSRDNLDTPEPNAPNTIDGCEDGISGKYLEDESIESITVTSLEHNFFKIGDPVKVEIQVYCSDGFKDKLNFVYSNNISNAQWTVKDNKQCSSNGLQTLSTTFNLDNNIGQHAIRGIFGFNLAQNKVCGDDYYDDNDDVIIYVKECSLDNDCAATECDNLDKCYSGTYRDYSDRTNTCNQDFTCTHNTCTVYNEIITDIDGDGYDKECDNDCNDSSSTMHPGATELCNYIDDDCDGETDEGCAKYNITFGINWNLISIPFMLDNMEVSSVFDNLDYSKIFKFNGTNKKWKELNNNDIIDVKEGYWIKSNEDKTIELSGYIVNPTADLYEGWNLIGYPYLEEKDISELFDNAIVYAYNGSWLSYIPDKTFNSLQTLKPGYGYWVNVE